MFEIPSLDTFILSIEFLAKILVLILIFLYVLFTIIAYSQVHALNRLIFIVPGSSSKAIQVVFAIYILLVISLFVAAIVIL